MTMQETTGANPPNDSKIAPGPIGLGGWLILPILGFIGTIALTGWNMFQALREPEGLVAIYNATSGPLVALKLPIAASLISGTLVLLSAFYCLYLIFSKSFAVIKFATAHYLILALASLADFWAGQALAKALPSLPADPSLYRDAVRGVLIAFIWIPYFHLSRRVRNTFVPAGAPTPSASVGDGNAGIPR